MSATNATTNYSLPLFIGTDKPAWLVDWNGAMTDIDAQMKVNATAILANETAISGLSTTVSAHTTSISTISGQITTLTTGLNTAQGNINTINSLIGNGTPTTTDQTIIGAINEINAKVGDLDDLTTPATSIVAAINAITGGGSGVAASAVSYDNTTSGLAATNVQAAIDELAQAAPSPSGDVVIVAAETKIGTYLGKDLYRKAATLSNPTDGAIIDSTLTPAYIDDLVSVTGSYDISGGKFPIGFSTSTIAASVSCATGGITAKFSGITPTSVSIVVEYTKA